jgi:hypothetical protein
MKRMWSEEELEKMIQQGGGGGSSDVTASDIDSEEATAGQVLTADGEGGASWEDADGGKLYLHLIYLRTSNSDYFYINLYTNNETPFTLDTLDNYLIEKGIVNGHYLPITGYNYSTKVIYLGVCKDTEQSSQRNKLEFSYCNIEENSFSSIYKDKTSMTIVDTVSEI